MSQQFEELHLTDKPDYKSEKEQGDDKDDSACGDVEMQDDDVKWEFLEHNGPSFAPPYEPLPPDVKFVYDKKPFPLSKAAEEVAVLYAQMLKHEYTTKKAFNNNFFNDWKSVMTDKEKERIQEFSKCNFDGIHKYFQDKKQNIRKKEKEEKALKNEEILNKYGFCTIDGFKEKLCKFNVEPPCLYESKKENLMGKLKKRVLPEDVVINCSKDSVLPKPPPGHTWKPEQLKHDNTVTWLASWVSVVGLVGDVYKKTKYVMLDPSSNLKSSDDRKKYDTARELHNFIYDDEIKGTKGIRDKYRRDWSSSKPSVSQCAVAAYFIDHLALRPGASTSNDDMIGVGGCSLRVKHITLHEKKDGKDHVAIFDFPGKDDVRYYNEVAVNEIVFTKLKEFVKGKKESDELFHEINTQAFNTYLKDIMPYLTAKVFRTYNASRTLAKLLEEFTDKDATPADKIDAYLRANLEVAKLCNHQWATSKGKQQTDGKTTRPAPAVSKSYYNDPRITVAWCRKNKIPIEKIFSKYLRDKFQWAIDMGNRGELDDFVYVCEREEDCKNTD